jgi:hypothetical protein
MGTSPRGYPGSSLGCIGAVEYQGGGTLGIGRGEQHAHRAALGAAHEHGSLRADRIHDGPQVVHPLFQRREISDRDRVGEPGAALIESDQSCKRAKAANATREWWILPSVLQVGNEAQHPDEINQAIPNDLIGNVDIAALSVERLGLHDAADLAPGADSSCTTSLA